MVWHCMALALTTGSSAAFHISFTHMYTVLTPTPPNAPFSGPDQGS
jgi:hypothetical protein